MALVSQLIINGIYVYAIDITEPEAIVASCKYVDEVQDSSRKEWGAWENWHYNENSAFEFH